MEKGLRMSVRSQVADELARLREKLNEVMYNCITPRCPSSCVTPPFPSGLRPSRPNAVVSQHSVASTLKPHRADGASPPAADGCARGVNDPLFTPDGHYGVYSPPYRNDSAGSPTQYSPPFTVEDLYSPSMPSTMPQKKYYQPLLIRIGGKESPVPRTYSPLREALPVDPHVTRASPHVYMGKHAFEDHAARMRKFRPKRRGVVP